MTNYEWSLQDFLQKLERRYFVISWYICNACVCNISHKIINYSFFLLNISDFSFMHLNQSFKWCGEYFCERWSTNYIKNSLPYSPPYFTRFLFGIVWTKLWFLCYIRGQIVLVTERIYNSCIWKTFFLTKLKITIHIQDTFF